MPRLRKVFAAVRSAWRLSSFAGLVERGGKLLSSPCDAKHLRQDASSTRDGTRAEDVLHGLPLF